MSQTAIEIIGYFAIAFLVVSFLFKDIFKLRLINSVGGILFVIYGILLHAYPVAIGNGIIVCINLYHLFFKKIKQ